MRKFKPDKIPFDEDYRKELLQRVLCRFENMSYEEAQRELLDPVFDLFKRTHPERCPLTDEKLLINKIDEILEEDTEKPKRTSRLRNPRQPRLF